MKISSPHNTVVKNLHYIYLIAISMLFLICVGIAATNRPLWYDEFFSLYISKLPSFSQIINSLLNRTDTNPPLDYFFRHFSIKLFGDNTLSFRLPSLFFFLLGSLFLYKFVKSKTNSICALATFSFPILTLALRYAHEGRPYSLLFASTSIALYSWQQCIDSKKKLLPKIFLFLSLSAGCYSHLYGVFNFIPIFAGETYRLLKNKKFEFEILSIIFLSLISLSFLYPFIVNTSIYSSHFWAKLSLIPPLGFFNQLFTNIVYPTILGLLFFCIYTNFHPEATNQKNIIPDTESNNPIPPHEIFAVLVFCLIPFIQHVAAILVTKALTPRYTIATVNGISILVGYFCFNVRKRNSFELP